MPDRIFAAVGFLLVLLGALLIVWRRSTFTRVLGVATFTLGGLALSVSLT